MIELLPGLFAPSISQLHYLPRQTPRDTVE